MEPRFASSRRPRPLRQAREKRGSAGAELDSAPGALLLAPGQRPMTPQRQAVELIVVHEKSLRAVGRLALGGGLGAVARGARFDCLPFPDPLVRRRMGVGSPFRGGLRKEYLKPELQGEQI